MIFFKEYPYPVTGPKSKGEECIIIETQQQRAHLLKPDDDITIANQTIL